MRTTNMVSGVVGVDAPASQAQPRVGARRQRRVVVASMSVALVSA